MSQLKFDFESEEHTECLLSELEYGHTFRSVDASNNSVCMKVKPLNFLNNSNVIHDIIRRGDCLVANIAKGTLYCMAGNKKVILLDVDAKVRKG